MVIFQALPSRLFPVVVNAILPHLGEKQVLEFHYPYYVKRYEDWLKPENILLDSSGYCKLTDFGLQDQVKIKVQIDHAVKVYDIISNPDPNPMIKMGVSGDCCSWRLSLKNINNFAIDLACRSAFNTQPFGQ
jgi:hypothetical protein